uniref:YheT family hydrolase n=1 Tax=uncultured Acidovorax sp. TaxID=158751 RepID=UPI0030F627D5
MKYVAPWWLPGGQMQTIWPAVFSRRTHGPAPAFRRERWTTPDADFIDVDFLAGGADRPPAAHSAEIPMLVVFHGLEGSSRSHYCQAFAEVAQERGWACALPHFRGCSGELNHAPRAYHSGDYEEIAWILAQLRARHPGPVIAAGVSLGGNALLRWAAEAGSDASSHVKAVAAICSPLDLAAGGHAIGRGFNRQIYTRMFLQTMVPKALRKWEQHPGLFDRDALLAARDLYAFDNVFTAPVHGFRNTEDYWHRASSKPLISHIRVPALVVNALNDPFVPASSLPRAGEVGPCVTLWQPSHGGHVGFAQGPWPGHVRAMPDAVSAWLTAQLPG